MDILELHDRAQAEDLRNRTEASDGWTPVTLDTLDIPADVVERRTRPASEVPACTLCGWDLTIVDIGGVCRQCRLSYHSSGNDPLPPWRMS